MKPSLIALVFLTLGVATQASAADVSGRGQSVCPTRNQGETFHQFRDRTHAVCEARWQALGASATGSHDVFINVCTKGCYAEVGQQSLAGQGDQAVGNRLTTSSGLFALATAAAFGTFLGVTTSQSPASP